MQQRPRHQDNNRSASRTLFANLTNGRMRLLLLMSVIVGLGLVLTACGGSDSDSTTSDPFAGSTGFITSPKATPTSTQVVLSPSRCIKSTGKIGDTRDNPVPVAGQSVSVKWTSQYNRQTWERCRIYVASGAKVRFYNSSDTTQKICKEDSRKTAKGLERKTDCRNISPNGSYSWKFDGPTYDFRKVYLESDGPDAAGVQVYLIAVKPTPTPTTVELSKSTCAQSSGKIGDTKENPVTRFTPASVSWSSTNGRQSWERCQIYVTRDANLRFVNSSNQTERICSRTTTGSGRDTVSKTECNDINPKGFFSFKSMGNPNLAKVYIRRDGYGGRGLVNVLKTLPPPTPTPTPTPTPIPPSGTGTQSDPLLLGKDYYLQLGYTGGVATKPETIFAVGVANITMVSRGGCTGVTRTIRVIRNGSPATAPKDLACGKSVYLTLQPTGSSFTTFVVYENIDNKPNVLATVIVTPE